jgi:hypothetical protein
LGSVPEETITAPAASGSEPAEDRSPPTPRARPRVPWPAVIVAVLVLLGAVAFVLVTRMRPAYDAWGWLVWGKQTLHGSLNTNGAPSWKPLTYLFTLPYALAGHTQVGLWMVTATASAFAGAVIAGRIAYRLTGPAPQARYAPIVAALFAGIGILGISIYWQLILIANSDPMVVTFCLAAIDAHLCRRPRLAFLALAVAALGRPEVWAFLGLYAIWCWRTVPPARLLVAAGLVFVPAFWFVVPGLTSKSWFISGDLALNSINVIHGNKITGVVGRFFGLYELPMLLAWLAGVVLAIFRRDRTLLTLAGAAVLWVVIEIALTYHGWSGVPRYLIEPAAVMVVLGAVAVGRVLAEAPAWPGALRWAGPAAVGILLLALIPSARNRERTTRAEIIVRRHAATEDDRLEAVIARDGGATRIKSCGQPVTTVGAQSLLAWEVGLSVGFVGYKPARSIQRGVPIVLFKPHHLGWQVRPVHSLPSDSAACAKLRADTAFG